MKKAVKVKTAAKNMQSANVSRIAKAAAKEVLETLPKKKKVVKKKKVDKKAVKKTVKAKKKG